MPTLPTLDQVKTSVAYDPETGIFFRPRKKRDGSDFKPERISRSGYLRVSINQEDYQSHRVAWFLTTGTWPEKDIDHINGIKTDNRFSNLRLADRSQNMWNTRIRRTNKCGTKGVYLCGKKWVAKICARRIRLYLGRFNTKEEASDCYKSKAAELFGEFANIK